MHAFALQTVAFGPIQFGQKTCSGDRSHFSNTEFYRKYFKTHIAHFNFFYGYRFVVFLCDFIGFDVLVTVGNRRLRLLNTI